MSDIRIENLTKVYGNLTAVDRLNLTIHGGEFFALLGVNGAGKSTTVKMLSCLAQPTDGDAFVGGHSIKNDTDAVKHIIGVSPQETAVAQNLTVRENLELMGGVYGESRERAAAKADELIRKFSLQKVENQRAKTLSGGFQRRLSIAMSLVSEPEVLFLDEPTLGLDVLARRELWTLMEQLKGKITVILTTHYLEEAEALSDRIAIMAEGKLCDVGTAAELKEKAGKENFEDAFIELVNRALKDA